MPGTRTGERRRVVAGGGLAALSGGVAVAAPTASSQPGRISGTDAISRSVYGWNGGAASPCGCPIRPSDRRRARRSSQIARTVEMSWLMKMQERPELAAQLREQLEDRGGHHRVERRGDLVAEDEVGFRSQRAREVDALLLAAGELRGITTGDVRRQVHQVEQTRDALARLRAAQTVVERSGRLRMRSIECAGFSAVSASWNTI